jgi:predicted dehydrogenase
MEYGNGITGDMCVHMFDTVRWMLGLGWPQKITATGGIYVQKEGKSNIADTQTAIFEYDELNCVWQHRTWGTPADPEYPWSFKLFGEKGTLSGSTMRADFVPFDKDVEPIHFDVLYEKEKYPEDLIEKDNELNAAPATRRHMLDFLAAINNGTRPIADIEEGHISTASCILANMAMDLKRPLVYDPKSRTVLNDTEATKLLVRPYRGPWEHPMPRQFQ